MDLLPMHGHKVRMHGFNVHPGDGMLYVHPTHGMMRLHVLDVWQTMRLGNAKWFELWTAPNLALPELDRARFVAMVLVRDFTSCTVWPEWGRAMVHSHENIKKQLASDARLIAVA